MQAWFVGIYYIKLMDLSPELKSTIKRLENKEANQQMNAVMPTLLLKLPLFCTRSSFYI